MSDVVIVGGGPGGLAAAVALCRRGVEVTVVERRERPGRDVYGLCLWPPASRVLSWLGVLDQVLAAGCRLRHLRWLVGHLECVLDLEKVAGLGPFVGVAPSQLELALSCETERMGIRVLRGARCTGVARTALGSIRLLGSGIDSEFDFTPRIVIAADGPNSEIRRLLGHAAQRWQPPRQQIFTSIGLPDSLAESRQQFGRGWSTGSVSLGGLGSWVYSVRASDGSGTPSSATGAAPHGPMAAGLAAGDSGMTVVQPTSVRVRRWVADGLVLMGDAAHAMLPHLGFGGMSTLEDIPVLTEVVTGALAANDTSAAQLAEFERRRRPRVRYMQRKYSVIPWGGWFRPVV